VTVTLGHALAGAFVSLLILVIVVLLAVRTTRTVFPVRCVHCWMLGRRETVVAFSKERHRWAICPDCVSHYWRFSESRPPDGEGAVPLITPPVHSPDRSGRAL
jgi:hypothetical protein